MELMDVNDADFEAEVMESKTPVLVDFWAPWCGPCKAMGPVIQEMAETHGEAIRVVKVNVDSCPGTASRFGIKSIPAFFFFHGGKPVEQMIGMTTRGKLEAAIARVVSGQASPSPFISKGV